jgi:hypothetical protein
VAFSANKRKSLSELFMAPLTEHPTAAKGYMGHDEFAVVERRLVRRFPVYKAGDTNAAPSGGVRQLQYKLTRGEASWRLDSVLDSGAQRRAWMGARHCQCRGFRHRARGAPDSTGSSGPDPGGDGASGHPVVVTGGRALGRTRDVR